MESQPSWLICSFLAKTLFLSSLISRPTYHSHQCLSSQIQFCTGSLWFNIVFSVFLWCHTSSQLQLWFTDLWPCSLEASCPATTPPRYYFCSIYYIVDSDFILMLCLSSRREVMLLKSKRNMIQKKKNNGKVRKIPYYYIS